MRTHVKAYVCEHEPTYAILPRNPTKQIQTKLSLNVLACFPNRRIENLSYIERQINNKTKKKTNKPRDKGKNKYLTQEAFRV